VRLVLFDLDGTLLPNDSDHAFNEFMLGLGWADGEGYRRRNDAFYADYQQGRLDIDAYIDFATAPWRDRPWDEVMQASARFIEKVMRPAIRLQAVRLVDRHREAGDVLAIVTATNDFVTRPVAELFGVDELIATELARDERGRVTGAIAGVPAFREGKVTRVNAWLAARGLALSDLDCSTFYSDSVNDLPLLEQVSRPVATNPSPALQRVAEDRRWPVLHLFDS
jgi:HAD superfamily hydrolase (TIGR01490 family)